MKVASPRASRSAALAISLCLEEAFKPLQLSKRRSRDANYSSTTVHVIGASYSYAIAAPRLTLRLAYVTAIAQFTIDVELNAAGLLLIYSDLSSSSHLGAYARRDPRTVSTPQQGDVRYWSTFG